MDKRFFLIISLLSSIFLSSQVRAQEVSEPLSSPTVGATVISSTVADSSSYPTPVKTIEGGLISQNLESVSISLAVVLLVIFLLAWLVRKAAPLGSGGGRGQMKVLSILPLGGKEKIILVDVAGTQMVLGISAAGVNCLHVFTDPVVLDHQLSSRTQGFQAILQGFVANKATNKDAS